MTFAQTYREERLINRRSRARKARIAGRIIGFALTACFVVALRVDPQLRGMVEDLAMAVIGVTDEGQAGPNGTRQSAQAAAIDALGYGPDSTEAEAIETLGISEGEPAARPEGRPVAGQMPQSRTKINRPTSG